MNKLVGIGLLGLIATIVFPTFGGIALAEDDCQDIKYEDDPLDMPGNDHDDNNPSEKEFKELIFEEDATLCEVAFCYDNHQCKGELDGKELNQFFNEIAFESGSEDQQDCIKYRADLPDDGRNALQAYELFDCGVEKY